MPEVKSGNQKYAYKSYTQKTDTITTTLNQWETILDTTLDIRLIRCRILQDNDDATAKDYEARITYDGNTISMSASSLNDNTLYNLVRSAYSDALNATTSDHSPYGNLFPWEAQSMKIEIRQTSALGTNQVTKYYIDYETLEVS